MLRHEMFGLTPQTTIRDSLYDLIPLPAEAGRILRTRAFLRLDGIQQLGFVSRIWPGARHTRFEHSLGVMHLMREALVRLDDSGAAFSPEAARTGIAAALLHDVGHYPFSHAIEELGGSVAGHESVGRKIILEHEIADILARDWRVDPSRVAELIDPLSDDMAVEDRLIQGLLSGSLDVDKLDYLPRDARACSVPYGGVDSSRLLDSLTIIRGANEQVIGITHKGVSPLHSLINARQEMFDNVYWHHTNRACMVMLLRAVQDALLSGSITPGELTDHTDTALLERLAQPDSPQTTRQLVNALNSRQFHKRSIEFSYRSAETFEFLSSLFFQPERRRELERSMVAQLRSDGFSSIGDADVLIDIPKPERWRTRVTVQFDRPPVGFAPVMSWQEVTGIEDRDLRTYEEHRRLIRIVVTEPLREIVRERWERLILPLLAMT